MPRPWFLFAHGAGAPSSSSWMRRWRDYLRSLGEVVTFDYPYMQARRKMPDRMPALVAAHRAELARVRAEAGDAPIFLAGKSMGSRVGCHLSLEEPVAGLVCFGYPLVSGSSGALRDEVLVALRTPILFLQGTHDSLCPIAKLEDVRARMTAPSWLYTVQDANHSLELPSVKHTPALQRDLEFSVLEAVRRFLDDVNKGARGASEGRHA
ncbi:MAG TPA: alpha/beta fold hydrolase [Polyangia bacterium]|nr:alpha/beta fold hydrolase [Polyangia bacterium]